MCTNLVISCSCGKDKANVMNKNNILPPHAIRKLYCPECSKSVDFDASTMIQDNGWIIEYNLPLIEATFIRLNVNEIEITPETIFDNGYCSWNGLTPKELDEGRKQRAEIVKLAKVDMKAYLEKLKNWGNQRMEELKKQGWRKAQRGAY
ncbi:MAG TPA: hypothetical protein ENI41_04395 [Deltaproteobacteria bacterium]|nr:hypothetical protein [Deltaproteobacteria bacterium]